MDNQHQLIKGYRDLTAEEIALINEVKALAESTRELVERAARLPATPLAEGDGPPTVTTDPGRAVSIARTELQTGFMWLIRSIARPTTF